MTTKTDWWALEQALIDYRKGDPATKIALKTLTLKDGFYSLAIRNKNGKRTFYGKKYKNEVVYTESVLSMALQGADFSKVISELKDGAVLEVHYEYKFPALLAFKDDDKIQDVVVRSKLALNGLFDKYPKHFRYVTESNTTQQGCFEGMLVTDIPVAPEKEKIAEILSLTKGKGDSEITKPFFDITPEMIEFAKTFPNDPKSKDIQIKLEVNRLGIDRFLFFYPDHPMAKKLKKMLGIPEDQDKPNQPVDDGNINLDKFIEEFFEKSNPDNSDKDGGE